MPVSLVELPRHEEIRLVGCDAAWLLYEPSRRNVLQLLVTANVVPSSAILSTLMMEAIGSSDT
jgi:hypothetical protein